MFVNGRVTDPPKTRTASTTLSQNQFYKHRVLERERSEKRERERAEKIKPEELGKSISSDLWNRERKGVVLYFFLLFWIRGFFLRLGFCDSCGMVVFFYVDLGICQYSGASEFPDLWFDGRIPIALRSRFSSRTQVFIPFFPNQSVPPKFSIRQFHSWVLSVFLRVNGEELHGRWFWGLLDLCLLTDGTEHLRCLGYGWNFGEFDRRGGGVLSFLIVV